MAPVSYDIVPYARGLEPDVVRLLRQFYPDAASSAAYLRWKYAENPYVDETILHLAVHRGRVVAMRGMFGAVWQVDGEPTRHLFPCADDFVIAPEHRNRGMARLILDAASEDGARRGHRFALSLSAGPVTFVSSLAAGWRSAGSYRPVLRSQPSSAPIVWIRRVVSESLHQTGMRGAVDRVQRSLKRYLRGPFDRFDRAPLHDGNISIARAPRLHDMVALIDRLPWDGRIRHVRDPAYFAWRFRNPMREYRFLFWDDGGLQGYLVLQRSLSDPFDQDLVNIADWEAADEHIAAELLRASLDRGRFGRVQAWGATVAPPRQAALDFHGFTAADQGGIRARSHGLLVRKLGEPGGEQRWRLGSRDLLQITDWDLRMIYSMSA
jgi:GNAT superfamily N-acetyltransferase